MLVLLASISAFAQTYRAFPLQNAVWIESHGYLTTVQDCGYAYLTCIDHLSTGMDTLVGDVTYAKLWRQQVCDEEILQSSPSCPGDYYSVPRHLYALLRQDTLARTVHVRFPAEEAEYLLYDFNMDIGPYPDTYNNQDYPVEVVGIDSVLLFDGYHKRWLLSVDSWIGPGAVIEGVGSDFGLLTQMISPFENHDYLNCFGVANELVYLRDGVDPQWECDLSVGMNEPVSDVHTIRASPNPASGPFFVELSGNGSTVAVLLNSSGQRVQWMRLAPGRSVVEVDGLSPGLYLLRCADGRAVRVMVE